MVPFPGVDGLRSEMVYRTMGDAASRERLGIGFMDKSGVTADFVDYDTPGFVLVYVLRGTGTYVDDAGARHHLRAGRAFQRIPGRIHTNLVDPDSGWKEGFLQLGVEMSAALAAAGVIRPEQPVFEVGEDLSLARRLWERKEFVRTCGEMELGTAMVEVVSLIVELFRRGDDASDDGEDVMIAAACDYLGSQSRDRGDLPDFCKAQGWGYESFRKRFQRRMGISPNQYRIRRRLDQARQLLRSTALPVAAIAEQLGYASPYEFSAQFKRHVGVPPKQYRPLRS